MRKLFVGPWAILFFCFSVAPCFAISWTSHRKVTQQAEAFEAKAEVFFRKTTQQKLDPAALDAWKAVLSEGKALTLQLKRSTDYGPAVEQFQKLHDALALARAQMYPKYCYLGELKQSYHELRLAFRQLAFEMTQHKVPPSPSMK